MGRPSGDSRKRWPPEAIYELKLLARANLPIHVIAFELHARPIYRVTHDLMTGRTQINCGPSALLELFRAARPRKPDPVTLEAEEEDEPIEYRANSVNVATRPFGGGDGDDGNTFNILIEVEDKLDFLEGAFEVNGRVYTGGGQVVQLPVEGQPHPGRLPPSHGPQNAPCSQR